MKPRFWAAVLIFISGYSPLLLILCLRDFDFERKAFAHPIPVEIMLVVAVLSVFLVFQALRSIDSGMSIQIVSVRSRATDLVNYSLPYIVSFVGLKLADPHDMGSLAVLMILLFLLAYRTNCLFINPILASAGYQLFEAEYEQNGRRQSRDVLIKGELKPGDCYRAERLASNLLLITRENAPTNSSQFESVRSPEEAEGGALPDSTRDLVVSS